MAKTKTAFFCQNCGTQYAKWVGQCGACKEWNTIVEEVIQKEKDIPWQNFSDAKTTSSRPVLVGQINASREFRLDIYDEELNRVLGGGLVPGSLVLFGGEPGIGKSTLLLQLAISTPKLKVLYVSGEESDQQIKMRSDRIGVKNDECFILTETNLQNIFKQAEKIQPAMMIIDSIQTIYSPSIESSPGSISQVRETTAQLLRYAKTSNVPVFLIGHITKEGSLAGPKVLEHMVDAVLQFEGDRNHVYRLLRSIKNRFGSTNELGIYEMLGSGLRQVVNPSDVLIT